MSTRPVRVIPSGESACVRRLASLQTPATADEAPVTSAAPGGGPVVGAASDQQTALTALGAVNAPVYSLAKHSIQGNPASGSPVTFVLGYKP